MCCSPSVPLRELNDVKLQCAPAQLDCSVLMCSENWKKCPTPQNHPPPHCCAFIIFLIQFCWHDIKTTYTDSDSLAPRIRISPLFIIISPVNNNLFFSLCFHCCQRNKEPSNNQKNHLLPGWPWWSLSGVGLQAVWSGHDAKDFQGK